MVHGGVVQYDMGKTMPSGFEWMGLLNSPPLVLLSAVAKVRANELRGWSKLLEHVSKLGRIARFQRVKAEPDVLFAAAYDYSRGQTCDRCSVDRQEARQPRKSEEDVVVQYGTIALGNQVMSSMAERDKVGAELGGVLCFEMEAAGLMNSFSCLVICGICDYADLHKNKRWQPYAAVTAAACAKEVLLVIPPAEVANAYTLCVLQQKLMVDQECQKLSIVGLGGTGKTQVTLQFAYSVKETRSKYSILLVPALSMASFEQACAGFAGVLRIPQAAGGDEDVKEVVQQHLSSSRAGRRLFVIDNADDADIFLGTEQSKGIVDYLPKSETGVVVYTTRTPEVAELTRGDFIELGAMDCQDAAAFFTKSLTKKDLLRDEATTTELLDELTCLPLAIAQAAAYLN
jgi:hypothetical protein